MNKLIFERLFESLFIANVLSNLYELVFEYHLV